MSGGCPGTSAAPTSGGSRKASDPPGIAVFVTLGDLTLEIRVKPGRHAAPQSLMMTSGGAAANWAVWVARLGAEALFIGKVGTDEAARLLVTDLLEEGVVPDIMRGDGPTATLTQVLKPLGRAEFIADRGVAVELTAGEVAESSLAQAEWLHLPATALWASPIASAAAKAVRLARSAGAAVSIDLCSASGLKAYGTGKFTLLLKTIKPDVIFAAQDEAVLFSAGALGGLARIAVLKLSDGGCALADEKGYRECGPPDARRIDLAGAGDAFAAAWCVTYRRTGSPDLAAQQAVKLYAMVAAQHGARPQVNLRELAVS
jgi:ribokinase